MNRKTPIVSICCITYNHEKYIRDAIEGFLMQKSTFPIEIIIHDDASTDRTAEIVKSYAEKHSDLILPILQAENQFSKGVSRSTYAYPMASGKYVAFCEGDDYWTDPYKLQKQVDFLESNPDCSWCFHAARNVCVDGKGVDHVYKPRKIPKSSKFNAKDVILGGGGFFPSASAMFRAHVLKDVPDWVKRAPIGDYPMALLASSKGYAGYIGDVMCVYRKNVPGSHSLRLNNRKGSRWENMLYITEEAEKYLLQFNNYSIGIYEKIVKVRIIEMRYNLFLTSILCPNSLNNLVEWIKSLKNSDIQYKVSDYLTFSYVFAYMTLRVLKRHIRSHLKKV